MGDFVGPKNPASRPARVVANAADIDRALTRMAHEILESNHGSDQLVVLGIPRRGVPLAHRISEKIAGIDPDFDATERTGTLDITLYRDDLRTQASRIPVPTSLPRNGIDDAVVVLVDDVLFSGRTVRAGLDALSDIGRPAAVRLAVLVDRGHRQLPIRADHVGKNLPTSTAERVSVWLEDVDGTEHEDCVIISDTVVTATGVR